MVRRFPEFQCQWIMASLRRARLHHCLSPDRRASVIRRTASATTHRAALGPSASLWCIPAQGNKVEVREIVQRCPSGAPTYRDKDGASGSALAANTVMVVYKGPLYLSGGLDIAGAPAEMPGLRFRAALCRCGRSAKKPLCDGSHTGAGFSSE